MSALQLVNVEFAYPQQTSLIQEISLNFPRAWTGIVGANGSGKSTLFQLILGELQPTSGEVHRNGLSIGWCPQDLGTNDAVLKFAYEFSKTSLRWMSLLELEFDDIQRWQELSPGMKRRWQIGATLASQNDVLLLDEPSNHLDAPGKAILLRALIQYQGIGLVISHDRALLDALCQQTLRLHHSASLYPVPYTEAKALWLAEDAVQLDQLEALQTQRDTLKRQLGAARSRHAAAQHKTRTSGRMKSINDSDARSTAKKSRAAKAEARMGRSSGLASAAHSGVERALKDLEYRPSGSTGTLRLDASNCSHVWLIRRAGPLSVNGMEVLEDCTFDLQRDDRVWLTGPNGCGKTTLLRSILAELPANIRERTLHVPQDPASIQALSAETLRSMDPEHTQQVFNISAALGLVPERLADIRAGQERSLSPGEWRKAAIAIGLTMNPWLVILDEPTNDLDIPSIEGLEAALQAYDGALLLVTHDAYFAQATRASPRELPWRT